MALQPRFGKYYLNNPFMIFKLLTDSPKLPIYYYFIKFDNIYQVLSTNNPLTKVNPFIRPPLL